MAKEIVYRSRLLPDQSREIQRFVDNCPRAHIFQTLAWEKVKQSISSDASAYFWIHDEKRILFFSLIHTYNFRYFNKFHGSIACGPVFNDITLFKEALPHLIEKLTQNNFVSFDLNPFWFNEDAAAIERIIVENGGQCIQTPGDYHYASVAIDLHQDEHKIYASFKNSSTRQMIQKAEKLPGIQIREGTEKDLRLFADLYNTMMASKNVSSRLKGGYIAAILRYIIKENLGFFLVQEYFNEPVAMAISLVCGETAVYTYGVSTDQRKEIPKGHLLQWHLIKRAKARNLRYYDMGGIVQGINKHINPSEFGVTQFKLGFSPNTVISCKKHVIILRKTTFNIFKLLKSIKKRFF